MAQATYLEAIRQGLLRLVVLGLFSAACPSLDAQKIGEANLTLDAPPTTAQPSLPAECGGVPSGYTNSDGYVLRQGSPLKLELNVESLSNAKPALGDTVEAWITLKNVDETDIVIPWSTDPNVAKRPPAATHHEYESAWLWIRIKDASGQQELLKSISLPLYSSAALPQTAFKLSPGQWVSMRIKFRFLVDEDRPSRSLTSGPAEVRIEWRQGNFSWERTGCDIKTGYFSYSGFYEQKTRPIKILLLSSKDEQALTGSQK
jgi:hypothetical protein